MTLLRKTGDNRYHKAAQLPQAHTALTQGGSDAGATDVSGLVRVAGGGFRGSDVWKRAARLQGFCSGSGGFKVQVVSALRVPPALQVLTVVFAGFFDTFVADEAAGVTVWGWSLGSREGLA